MKKYISQLSFKKFNKQRETLLYIIYFFSFPVFAHEQWMLTSTEMKYLNQQPPPSIFTHFNILNAGMIISALIIILLWSLLNIYLLPPPHIKITRIKLKWCLFFLRFFTGSMLILCSIGIPKQCLLAPDLIIHQSGLIYLQFIAGLCLVAGVLIKLNSMILVTLITIALFLFKSNVFPYIGFYLGSCICLLYLSPQTFENQKNNRRIIFNFYVLQILVGLNFMYNAISIKYFYPNLDVYLLKLHHSITFGLSYDYFTLLMLIVEFTAGLFIIFGWHLRLIAICLMILFIFMSFNLSENIFYHNFIYGSMFTFMILNGIPLQQLLK